MKATCCLQNNNTRSRFSWLGCRFMAEAILLSPKKLICSGLIIILPLNCNSTKDDAGFRARLVTSSKPSIDLANPPGVQRGPASVASVALNDVKMLFVVGRSISKPYLRRVAVGAESVVSTHTPVRELVYQSLHSMKTATAFTAAHEMNRKPKQSNSC